MYVQIFTERSEAHESPSCAPCHHSFNLSFRLPYSFTAFPFGFFGYALEKLEWIMDSRINIFVLFANADVHFSLIQQIQLCVYVLSKYFNRSGRWVCAPPKYLRTNATWVSSDPCRRSSMFIVVATSPSTDKIISPTSILSPLNLFDVSPG